jgi:hypothetical protein
MPGPGIGGNDRTGRERKMAKTGKRAVQPPEKNQHMKHFDDALKDALQRWDPSDGTPLQVTFEIDVTPNPGGIKEYRVTIS